jgi:hypothetical protein
MMDMIFRHSSTTIDLLHLVQKGRSVDYYRMRNNLSAGQLRRVLLQSSGDPAQRRTAETGMVHLVRPPHLPAI